MTDLLRIIFLIVGLFLIAVALAGFVDIQTGGLTRESLAYLSPPNGSNVEATPTLVSVGSTLPAMTDISNPATVTVAAAFTQLVVPTATAIPTATVVTGYYPPPPSGGFLVLGRHTVQAGEYLFCIGRAYGVSPEAIADWNSLPVDSVLLVGQKLLIPDVRWEDIPTGQICKPQFTSPYAPKPTPTAPLITDLFPESSADKQGSKFGEIQLINFVLPAANANLPDLSSALRMETPTPEPIAETRIVKVDLPTQMRLGGSSQVLLTFNAENGQPTVTVTTAAGETQVAATMTSEPGQSIYSSNPLVIPDVFEDFRIYAVARLYAAGFDYSPPEDMQQEVILGRPLTWRWSIKPQDAEPQELIINLRLHYEPKTEGKFRADEVLWSDSFHVDVTKNLFASLFGAQASVFAGFSLITGSLVSLFSIWDKIKPGSKKPAEKQNEAR